MAKFVVVHPNMDIFGGGERVCHHILKTLAFHGQQVELLTFDFDQSRYRQIMGEPLPPEVIINMLGNKTVVEANSPLSVYKRRRNIISMLKKYKQTANYDYTFSTQTISAFETALFGRAKKNIAYIHFPEIHYVYAQSGKRRQFYLWFYKKMLERDLSKLDLIFCNSEYTKVMIKEYWAKITLEEPIVVYPPIEEHFWSNRPLSKRKRRVLYVARFVPQKRHDLLKGLAFDFPQLDFVSAGLLRDSEYSWYENFKKQLPSNYKLQPNLSEEGLIELLHDSQIYIHLMQGEHFGIAPMEALASGCITFVHNSGGTGEFVSPEFRWEKIEDLKLKIAKLINDPSFFIFLNKQKDELRAKISILHPKVFERQIWSNLETLMQEGEK